MFCLPSGVTILLLGAMLLLCLQYYVLSSGGVFLLRVFFSVFRFESDRCLAGIGDAGADAQDSGSCGPVLE